jgi:hypothetical protein
MNQTIFMGLVIGIVAAAATTVGGLVIGAQVQAQKEQGGGGANTTELDRYTTEIGSVVLNTDNLTGIVDACNEIRNSEDQSLIPACSNMFAAFNEFMSGWRADNQENISEITK